LTIIFDLPSDFFSFIGYYLRLIPPHPLPLPPGERGLLGGINLKIPPPQMGEGKGGGEFRNLKSTIDSVSPAPHPGIVEAIVLVV
jgi:hypothetical protein